jgi:hypothetical protein
MPETKDSGAQDWHDVHRQFVNNQMILINNTLTQMHVILATGIANNDWSQEFRAYVKQQLLQIAATVEVRGE